MASGKLEAKCQISTDGGNRRHQTNVFIQAVMEGKYEQEAEPTRLCTKVSGRWSCGGGPAERAARQEPAAGKPSRSVKAAGASVAKRRRLVLPPEVTYGGQSYDGHDVTPESTLRSAGQMTGGYADGWTEGKTIPVKYYVDDAIYAKDEEHLRENFWFMVDHHDRIRNPGDYFVFEFGRGDSVIVLRDKAGEVKAFHNVCRHRGSRVCQHGFDGVRPSEARPDGKPVDPVLSVMQLGPEGNTPVFRCPYHAWTYDLDGKLVSYPQGMASDFDASQNGLHPAHVRTVGGFIWVSLRRERHQNLIRGSICGSR